MIDTQRLHLRIPTLADFPAYAAMKADPVVMRYIRDGALDRETSWPKFAGLVGHWHLVGYGTWMIEDRESGAYVGNIGYQHKEREAGHPAADAPEMGWSLVAAAHGKGIASEALAGALDWGRDHFGAGSRVVCVIDIGNAASIKLAERHGFRRFAEAERSGLPRFVFERAL